MAKLTANVTVPESEALRTMAARIDGLEAENAQLRAKLAEARAMMELQRRLGLRD